MVTLVKELPYAAVVHGDVIPTVCSNCFKSSGGAPFSHCAACKVVRYCCTTCQKADWKDHKMECQFLKRAKPDIAFTSIRLAARILMKMSRGDFGKSFNGRTINDLMDHVEDIKGDALIFEKYSIKCQSLRKFMDGQKLPNDDELLSILGKISCNAVIITDKDTNSKKGYGLYLGLSVHDHSCDAEASVKFDGATMELKAKDGVKYSKEIVFSYLYLRAFETNATRRMVLRERYFFECSCSWCRDPDHEGWALSVRSPCCPDSACLLREDSTELSCNKCGKINKEITVAEARVLNDGLRLEVEKSGVIDMNRLPAIAHFMSTEDLLDMNYVSQTQIYEHFAKVLSPWNMNLALYSLKLSQRSFEVGLNSNSYAAVYLAAFRKYLGPDHPALSFFYIGAASCTDKLDEQEDLLKEAHALALRSFGPNGVVTKLAAEQLQLVRTTKDMPRLRLVTNN